MRRALFALTRCRKIFLNRYLLLNVTQFTRAFFTGFACFAQCATGVCRCKAAGVLAWKFEAGGQSRRAVASRQLPPASKKKAEFLCKL